jgi:hypothetical protein
VRDAPAEVLDLRDELELFAVVARDTEKLLRHASETFTTIDTVNYPQALERCECAGTAGQDKRFWWRRLKVASRKKTLAKYMQRLERAKGQLLAAQSNLTQYVSVLMPISGLLLIEISDRSFLLSQHNLQASRDKDNHEYLRRTDRIVSYIQSQETLFAEMNREFSDGLVGISNNLRHLRSRVEVATITRTAQEEVLRRDTEQAAASKVSDGNLSYPGFFLKSKNVLQRNSAEAHFRSPFFQRKVVFQYQSSPHPNSNGFDVQLRTYNIVAETSPIFEACRNFDLPRV